MKIIRDTTEDLFGLMHSLLGEALRTAKDLPASPKDQHVKERLESLLREANEIAVRFSPIYRMLT